MWGHARLFVMAAAVCSDAVFSPIERYSHTLLLYDVFIVSCFSSLNEIISTTSFVLFGLGF